jgi:iron complex outermembrane recepter protein
LPFIPPARYQSELRANFKSMGKIFSNAFFKTEFVHYWAQDRVLLENRTETATGSYSLINVDLGTDILSRNGKTLFSVYISGNNLFDVAYQNHLSRLKYATENQITGRAGVFNVGRNFSFKIVVPIAFKRIAKNSNSTVRLSLPKSVYIARRTIKRFRQAQPDRVFRDAL